MAAKIIDFTKEKRIREIAEQSILEFEVFAVVKKDNERSEKILGGFTCKYQEAFKAFEAFLVQCIPYIVDNYVKSESGLPFIELRSVKQKEGKKVCAVFELLREEIPMKGFTYVKIIPNLVSADWMET